MSSVTAENLKDSTETMVESGVLNPPERDTVLQRLESDGFESALQLLENIVGNVEEAMKPSAGFFEV